MTEVKPFQGLRYNPNRVSDLSLVVAPPYDVISNEEEEELYRRHPCNVVRLILPRDDGRTGCYESARETLNYWIGEKVLQFDDRPSFYIYLQEYLYEGVEHKRLGVIGRLKLQEGALFPHEHTLKGPKEDRTRLLESVETNLSPIFTLYQDKTGRIGSLLRERVQKLSPLADIHLSDGRHLFYREEDPLVVGKIIQAFQKLDLFIADGHHRYEVALNYSRKRRRLFPDERELKSDYMMTYFSDTANNDLTLSATHRVIRFKPHSPLDIENRLKKVAKVEKLDRLETLEALLRHEDPKHYLFGLITQKEGLFAIRLTQKRPPLASAASVLQNLDVTLLNRLILEPLCDIVQGRDENQFLAYTRDSGEAFKWVRDEIFDAAFLVRPTSIEEVLASARLYEKMPQKSTYFLPKLLSGLVFYSLKEEEEMART